MSQKINNKKSELIRFRIAIPSYDQAGEIMTIRTVYNNVRPDRLTDQKA